MVTLRFDGRVYTFEVLLLLCPLYEEFLVALLLVEVLLFIFASVVLEFTPRLALFADALLLILLLFLDLILLLLVWLIYPFVPFVILALWFTALVFLWLLAE